MQEKSELEFVGTTAFARMCEIVSEQIDDADGFTRVLDLAEKEGK